MEEGPGCSVYDLAVRRVDVTSLSLKEAEVLCWRLDGSFVRRDGKVFIEFVPTKIEIL